MTIAPNLSYLFSPVATVLEQKRQHPSKQSNAEVAILDQWLLPVILSIKNNIDEMRPLALKMSIDEALPVLEELKKVPRIVADSKDLMLKIGELEQPSKVEVAIYGMAESFLDLFENLLVAASDIPVDEDSDDYREFMESMINERLKEKPVVVTRAEFLALFED